MVADAPTGVLASGVARLTGVRLGYAAGPWVVSAATKNTKNSLTGSENLKDSAIGGHYDAGVVKVSAVRRQFKLTTAKQTNTVLAAVVPVGVGEIKLSWQQANLDGTVGAANISANDARIDNEGAATFVVPGGTACLAVGGTSTGYEAGIRHSF